MISVDMDDTSKQSLPYIDALVALLIAVSIMLVQLLENPLLFFANLILFMPFPS